MAKLLISIMLLGILILILVLQNFNFYRFSIIKLFTKGIKII